MPRPKPRPKIGPQLSHDAGDKLTACLNWYIGKDKKRPEYVQAPFYYDGILKWHDGLSLDNLELVGTVTAIYTTPRYGGEKVAERYAADLPAVPKPPPGLR